MRKSWKYTAGLLIISYWLLVTPAQALPEIKPTFPRLANYFLHWTISEAEAEALAKFDLVILDAEVAKRSADELQKLRRLNPRAILLAYVPASEVRRHVASLQNIAPLRYKLGAGIPEEWYLHDAAGSRRSFWPGTWIVDITGPWSEHLSQFVAREILSSSVWDGVFYDNAWDNIVHFARGVPDLNRDGLTDDENSARQRWRDGLRALYRRTAELVPDKFVFENDGPMYAPQVHGVLLENFPRKGWARHVEEVRRVLSESRDPAVAILNANTFNTGRRDDFRAMRFGLTTALLEDAYFGFDFGDQDHGQTWFYDEYEAFLGEPLRDPRKTADKIWRRDFEKGIVLVNPEEAPRAVVLPVEVEKLRGNQDPSTNDGRITREINVSAKDGMVVLRPLTIIVGAPFENGIFARVFNAAGESTRAGFFAFDRRERSGVILASADLDGDAQSERVRLIDNTGIEVRFSDGRRSIFFPFGENWRKEVTFALGDLGSDGVAEIVVASAGQLQVHRLDGTLVVAPFSPFGPRYRGEVNVAVGDLNGDGFGEIVAGAGRGGGPQVRIFSGQGRLISGGFFAYDPRFRGGVRVAVGDINGDGADEIITGPGPGGGPQIRLFDGKGRPLSPGFFAFARESRAGAVPVVADLDGDGGKEILALTREIF